MSALNRNSYLMTRPLAAWVPKLCLLAAILLCAIILCERSSILKPRRVAPEPQASPVMLASALEYAEKKGLEAKQAPPNATGQPAWGFQNLRHRFASSFDEHGWALFSMSAFPSQSSTPHNEELSWRWRYQFTSLARDVGSQQVGKPTVSAQAETITLERSGGIKEWYKNAPSGIEQGFEIKERPLRTHAGELVLRGAVETDLSLISEDASSLTFGRAGQALVRYAELVVFDSTGKTIPSRLSFERGASGGQLALHIDDSQATYPVTVDPVTSSPLWTRNGDNITNQFGFSVASAGDVNGDGFADVVVGAPNYASGEADEGAVYLFLGAASGPSTDPSMIIESNSANAQFGYSVSTAGDVNNDGFSDVIVGAPGSEPCAYANGGQAFAFYGSASGLSSTTNWEHHVCVGNFFAQSVAAAGDVNNDGFSDVIVGCPGCMSSGSLDGDAFVFAGSAGGLLTVAFWRYDTADGDASAANFGSSVAGAGDVNNDGYSDVLVGADAWASAGRTFLFYGGNTMSLTPDWSDVLPVTSLIRASGAGDTNGDGFDDVLVGYPSVNIAGEHGLAALFFGSATGPSTTANWTKTGSDFATTLLGSAVSSAGDINNDGFDDILVSTTAFEFNGDPTGRAYLFLGSASGPETTEAWIATGEMANAAFGKSLACAGDVNNDGLPDVIVGSSGYGDSSGRALIWSDFNVPVNNPTPTPTPTPTPVVVFPGKGELPAPTVATSGRNATVTAPQVTPQLTTRAKNAAIKKLMQRGLSKAKATKAVSKLTVTYIFTVAQGGKASNNGGGDVGTHASSISRRSKRNSLTFANLQPGAKAASYRIEISTKSPPVVLGTTKPSSRTTFTISP